MRILLMDEEVCRRIWAERDLYTEDFFSGGENAQQKNKTAPVDTVTGRVIVSLTDGEILMTKYAIRKVPACQDWKGQFYPEHFQLVVYCSRGLAWDGGEFQTREEAVLKGESK